MKKILIIFIFFLGCGGGENIINIRFPDSISAIRKDLDYLFITSRTDRKYLLITGEGEKVDSGNLKCIPLGNIALFQKFFLFCENYEDLSLEIYTHEAQKGSLKLVEKVYGIYTGGCLCGDKICFASYRDGETRFYKIEPFEELFSHNGICTPITSTNFICDEYLYPDEIEIPGGVRFFPDPFSGPLLSKGREINVLKEGNFLRWVTLKSQPLSFIPFEDRIVFFDISGFARVINRKSGCEVKKSYGEVKEKASSISIEYIKTNDCNAFTEEWRIEYHGVLPGFPSVGRILSENLLRDEHMDFLKGGVSPGDILVINSPFEGEFEVQKVDKNSIEIKGNFQNFPLGVSYSVLSKDFYILRSNYGIYGRVESEKEFSSPILSFKIKGSPKRGDYIVIQTYEYGEGMPISCGSYPISATATTEERVYVLNETNPSITLLDLKGMKAIKTIW